jgi:hypothetical protein
MWTAAAGRDRALDKSVDRVGIETDGGLKASWPLVLSLICPLQPLVFGALSRKRLDCGGA